MSHKSMTTAKPISHEKVQEFLDEVSSLNLPKKYSDWYQVDVSTMLSNCQVVNHEIDTVSGDSLVFLKSSLLFCSPELGVMRHYPRSLVHCFVEDKRKKKEEQRKAEAERAAAAGRKGNRANIEHKDRTARRNRRRSNTE